MSGFRAEEFRNVSPHKAATGILRGLHRSAGKEHGAWNGNWDYISMSRSDVKGVKE